jgi:integrating conjugative element protein (TIGR03761 family)
MASKPRSGPQKAQTSIPFPVSPTSPFPDKYDIVAERAALKDLVEEQDFDKVVVHTNYGRYIELEKREALLRQMQQNHTTRGGADAEVGLDEAVDVNHRLGRLTDQEEDAMFLHTRESSRLFLGRAVEPGKTGYGQAGAKKVGAALRAIWYLSGNDNPYADFALLEASNRISELVKDLEQEITSREAKLEQMKKRGLVFSILKAEPAVRVGLGFRSPYGYSVVNLVSTFDYFVRVVKTLVRKDQLSDAEGYSLIYTKTRLSRSIFERVIWFQRYLMRDELRELSRSDWLPSASEEARKRVQAAVAIFGELPREVFNGQLVPRHSRRRLDLSDDELRVLNELPLAGADQELEAAAATLM